MSQQEKKLYHSMSKAEEPKPMAKKLEKSESIQSLEFKKYQQQVNSKM